LFGPFRAEFCGRIPCPWACAYGYSRLAPSGFMLTRRCPQRRTGGPPKRSRAERRVGFMVAGVCPRAPAIMGQMRTSAAHESVRWEYCGPRLSRPRTRVAAGVSLRADECHVPLPGPGRPHCHSCGPFRAETTMGFAVRGLARLRRRAAYGNSRLALRG
jgi:hypothetical protein